MRRRSSAGGEPAKAQRRKTVAGKSRVTSKAADPKSSSGAREETRVARLTNVLNEARQQQTATADVLKVISRSTFDLQTVLDTLIESAARLCEADIGFIGRPKGDGFFRAEATYGYSSALKDIVDRTPWKAGRESVIGRVLLERAPIHVRDVETDPEYRMVEIQKIGGYHSTFGVPLWREGALIGVLVLARRSVRPFTHNQIALVESFADQAVIAIENARLFDELRESLDQQTATSEVLQVISSSPGDLEPVFAAMLEKAVSICDATFGNIYRWQDGALHLVAAHNTPPALAEARRRLPLVPGQHPIIDRMVTTKTASQVIDAATTSEYIERSSPGVIELVELAGGRTALAVPMVRDNELIGSFTVYRQEVRPFTDKQIELVTNFAAQAVIAIENARLLNELRQRTTDLTERTADLTEALEQQTATSEVLQVISSSPGDLEPVFASMLENAVRICDATFGNIYRWDGEALHLVATHNTPPAFAEARRRLPFRPGPKSLLVA